MTNSQAKAYAILVLHQLGYPKEKIDKIIYAMHREMDEYTVQEAVTNDYITRCFSALICDVSSLIVPINL
jgi:hypothetical protein